MSEFIYVCKYLIIYKEVYVSICINIHILTFIISGSGKTMTLSSILELNPEFILASLNFSSGTTPDLILKTFAQYCEIVDSPNGLTMQPQRYVFVSTYFVFFCHSLMTV
jgi:hypothetical protein